MILFTSSRKSGRMCSRHVSQCSFVKQSCLMYVFGFSEGIVFTVSGVEPLTWEESALSLKEVELMR